MSFRGVAWHISELLHHLDESISESVFSSNSQQDSKHVGAPITTFLYILFHKPLMILMFLTSVTPSSRIINRHWLTAVNSHSQSSGATAGQVNGHQLKTVVALYV